MVPVLSSGLPEEARRVYGDVIPGHGRDKRIITIKQPIRGSSSHHTLEFSQCDDYPESSTRSCGGCTVVIKPAEDTPLSALALAVLAEEAGFPPGVFNIITTNRPAEVGGEMTSNPIVRKLSFTGSTPVGKLLMRQCA